MTNSHFKLLMKVKSQLEKKLDGRCNEHNDELEYCRTRLWHIELELIKYLHDNDLDWLPQIKK